LYIPDSELCDPLVFSKDKKCVLHIAKVHPHKPFSKLKVEVTATPKVYQRVVAGSGSNYNSYSGAGVGTCKNNYFEYNLSL